MTSRVSSIHSPDLTIPTILQFFKENEYNIQFQAEDLKNMNPEILRDTMNVFVDLHMVPVRTELKQAPFRAMEQLTYPELHEQGINEMETYSHILQFCWKIGLPHISLRHVLFPEPRSTREMLSAAVNYTLFQSEQAKLYQEFESRTTELMELKQITEGELTALQPELDRLQESYAKIAPVLKAREVEVAEWKELGQRKKKEAVSLEEEVKAIKEEMNEINSQVKNQQFKISIAKQEIEKLRSQIIKSPEKLRGRLEQMERDVETQQEEMNHANISLTSLQTERLLLTKVLNKLTKRVKTMKICEEEKKKAKELHQELKHKTQESQKEEEQLYDLKATAQHWEKQISSAQEKLMNLQRQGEQKRVKAQQALDETERQRREVEYSIKQDKEQVKQNQAIIQRKEQEVQRLNQDHLREMEALQRHYLQFAQSLRWYHSELLHAAQVGN